ncbi:ABC transporter permease [Alloacidobacterium dinghuense]|uniref:ABC transporter permease n=1 Tax=Alloacidobacterium dinghuense TaxID=2763107 RepID=A0A7G8BMW0_9BACT|nr:ABC transporter permease [Alloacidobacterium dinghuense]QNI33880.1 ABC transporter permease [Alloacidobacterium dinghuense]
MLTDIRQAFRRLGKAPGFTITAVLTLAIAIGGVTAVFSIVNAVLLRPLPFQDPARLVRLHEGIAHILNPVDLPAPDIIRFARNNQTFSALGGFVASEYELSGVGAPLHARAERVTASLFPMLGVHPMLGRNFTQNEDDNSAPVALISYALWRERFHSDAATVGRTIDLNRRPYTIIGIMPRNLEFPLDPGRLSHRDLWVPMSFTSDEKGDEVDNFQYGAIARLKPGSTLSQAQADIARMLRAEESGVAAQLGIHLTSQVRPLQEETVESARPLLRILLVAVGFILLIACANLANLLLVRAAGRRRESGVRLALGAAARTMLRHSLAESLVLSAIGGFLGVMLAAVTVRLGSLFLPASLPRLAEISIRWPVLIAACALTGLTGLVCGLAPALASMRTDILDALRDGGHANVGGLQQRLRNVLVVIETALALLLLVGSGLLLRSFAHMLETDPGFQPQHTLTAHLSLPQNDYSSQEKIDRFYAELLRRLSTLPQVRYTAASSNIPVIGINSDRNFVPEGYTGRNNRTWLSTSNYFIVGAYFSAMRIPLLRGRYLNASDDLADAPVVAVVSESLVRMVWPGKNPIGKRFQMGGNPDSKRPFVTVVGVVGDIRQDALDRDIYPQMYEPLSQLQRQFPPEVAGIVGTRGDMHLVINTAGDPSALANSLQRMVNQLDPLLAVEDIQTMDTVVSSTEAPRRFNTLALSSFAAVALLLALLGIGGVLAYTVSERTREIAIRMALGATRENVLGRILRSALVLAGAGIALGLAASLWLTRFLESLLYGVKPLDPAAFIAAVVVLLFCALLAGWLPARHAASIDPMQTLRAE